MLALNGHGDVEMRFVMLMCGWATATGFVTLIAG